MTRSLWFYINNLFHHLHFVEILAGVLRKFDTKFSKLHNEWNGEEDRIVIIV